MPITIKVPKVKVRRYRICTYDVWGNAKDGWEVNNVFRGDTTVDIRCRLQTFNEGTPNEFHTWDATDRQLNRALGIRGAEWESDGADSTHYAESARGKPLGELEYVGIVNADGTVTEGEDA